MPEETNTTPEQQGADNSAAPDQQASPAQTINLDDYVEKKRYTGAIQALQEKDKSLKELEAQLAARSSEIEQFRTQLSEADVEKNSLLADRDAKLTEATQKLTDTEKELVNMQAQMMKVDVAQEIGHPELIKLLDTIPSIPDKEALTNVMKEIAGFAEEQVKAREEELLSGRTPEVSPAQTTPAYPDGNNVEAWESYISKLDPFSDEYNQAMEAFHKAVFAQQ
jgi:hypothetical protein